jgi:predicted nuclease of predicted toxin-antitoxin system
VSKPALLANENVPALMVAELRRSGVHVESVSETMPANSDRMVIAHAAAQGLWILTFDRDYGELVFARGRRAAIHRLCAAAAASSRGACARCAGTAGSTGVVVRPPITQSIAVAIGASRPAICHAAMRAHRQTRPEL